MNSSCNWAEFTLRFTARRQYNDKGSRMVMQNADKVTGFFREICKIPHASYDEKRIGDYLVDFAEKRGLEHRRDKSGNVLIKKPSTVPGCKAPAVIIQGHMDMVYLRDATCTYDYEEGIKILERDGFMTADGTTLGADDGIALAYGLALLDSKDIPHPDLEVVFTVQEEVGLEGAANFDCSDLKGKYLINIDTEQEGVFCTSCAGAIHNKMILPTKREKLSGVQKMTLRLYGLKGGHSGMDIHFGRPNAIVLMFRLILALGGLVHIYSIDCDGKSNAIASDCTAVIYMDPDKHEQIRKLVEKTVSKFNAEFEGIDKILLELTDGEVEDAMCWTQDSHRSTLNALLQIPNGVIRMSDNIPGLVETSANPGAVKQEDDKIVVSSCIRSSVGESRAYIQNKLEELAAVSLGDSINSGDYPQWEYSEKSYVRDLAMESYRELFGKDPKATAIHAGLECGFFAERIPEVDIISFGPDQFDVHTTRERVDIASLERVWQLIQSLMEKLTK